MKLKWKILIAASAAALVTAGGGLWYYLGHNSSDPVYVYNMDMAGMTNFWGDSRESYGPVSTDRIQTVFVSDTQTVTEILVNQGDMVKKGDLLMTFDTTLSDIALERKQLEVQKLKLQLEDANAELLRINGLKPYTPPKPPKENPGTPLEGNYQLANDPKYDGSTPEKAVLCWIADSTPIDAALLEAVRQRAEDIQNDNAQKAYEESLLNPTEPEEPTEETTPPAPPAHITVTSCYTVFKVTAGNTSLGAHLTWQGAHIQHSESGCTFTFFDGNVVSDYMLTEEEKNANKPPKDDSSGFTAAQIQEMRVQQKETIKDLEFQLKMAEGELAIMEKELRDGNIYAETDGKVVSCLTEEEAKMTQQPILKVSGGGGFYIQGSVSELDRDELQIGQEVTVNDWEGGGMYTGTIQSVHDFPTNENSYSSMNNPNVSYYPFTVFVDESADLRAGYYVSIEYSSAGSEDVFYLRNPFLRSENGKTYVLVRDANGLLEKRFVTVGKTLWGSYTEIRSGLSVEDYVAFPYGKNVKPGAKTVEGDYTTLNG